MNSVFMFFYLHSEFLLFLDHFPLNRLFVFMDSAKNMGKLLLQIKQILRLVLFLRAVLQLIEADRSVLLRSDMRRKHN